MGKDNAYQQSGFTLIEVSVVLLVIGLIIGGVLVGQELIRAAQVRSQIKQIESYNTAINTFRLKYGGMPGDLQASDAVSLGFEVRSGAAGHGDGNGMVDGCTPVSETDVPSYTDFHLGCENTLMWKDLAQAQLIEGNFSVATDAEADIFPTPASSYFPEVKMVGGGSVITQNCLATPVPPGFGATMDGMYFVMATVGVYHGPGSFNNPFLKARTYNTDTYVMDSKIDDGLPLQGNVRYVYPIGIFGLAYAKGFFCWDSIVPILPDCVTPEKFYKTSSSVSTTFNCYPLIKISAMH